MDFPHFKPFNDSTMANSGLPLYNELRRATVEDAILLWSLTEVPEITRESALISSTSAWKLSVDKEKQLADDLAFIASSKEGCKQVKAVRVDENHDGNGVTIRVAANTGDLTHTVQELQTIADTMVQAGHRGMSRCDVSITLTLKGWAGTSRDEVKRSLLGHILRMCYGRILSQLRYKHAARTGKTAGKRSLPPLLLQTVLQCQHLLQNSVAKTQAAQARAKCDQFHEVFDGFETSQDCHNTLRMLEQLLILAHEFITIALLQTSIPRNGGIYLRPSLSLAAINRSLSTSPVRLGHSSTCSSTG